jgi:hypothetical protein
MKSNVAAVAVLALSGCWPALNVVQPRAEVRVTDAAGNAIEGARVTFVGAKVFPGWQAVLGSGLTDSEGAVKLPLKLKWHVQIRLPDAVASYSWAYCVERQDYRAVMAPLQRWQRPTVAVLESSAMQSTCIPPNESFPYLQITENPSAQPSN